MVDFPNAKINLGLNIVEKRPDGFHNIETVFYPVSWCDSLEILENRYYSPGAEKCKLKISGISIQGELKDNLIVKAYDLLCMHSKIPPVTVYLHKTIPMGAGLGGGSSNAAFFMKLLNQRFDLKITPETLRAEARKLGSDCAFFTENKPAYAFGKGDEFETIDLSLKGYKMVIVYPDIHSNTKIAYSRVIPKKPDHPLREIITTKAVREWKDLLKNDFEQSIFTHFPEIKKLKDDLYTSGAVYASLSGSGSSVFAFFPSGYDLPLKFNERYKVHECIC